MNEAEFEEAKNIVYYDEFMKTCLDYDNLTMEDYAAFMPKVLPVVLAND